MNPLFTPETEEERHDDWLFWSARQDARAKEAFKGWLWILGFGLLAYGAYLWLG